MTGEHYVGSATIPINYNLFSMVNLKGTELGLFPFGITIQLRPFSFLEQDLVKFTYRLDDFQNRIYMLDDIEPGQSEDVEGLNELGIRVISYELKCLREEFLEIHRVFVLHERPSDNWMPYFRKTRIDGIIDYFNDRLSAVEVQIQGVEHKLQESVNDEEDCQDE